MSYTAKPYQPPGKHSSLPQFNKKGDNDADKAKLASATMPSLSGDILKQRIASLHTKQSSNPPLNKPGLGPKPSNGIKKPPPPKGQGPPMINPTELMQRRESMHRTPPPPTPDSAKQKTDKTPEFLRKKLKPTQSKQSEQQKESGENDEATEDAHTKKVFRNSKLLFEKMSAQPPVAPKPRGRSISQEKPSWLLKPPEVVSRQAADDDEAPAVELRDEKVESDEGGPVRDQAPQDVAELTHKPTEADLIAESNEAVNRLDQIISAEESDDSTESDASAKPKDVTMPDIPPGLEAWLIKYVTCNCMLKKLNDLKSDGIPPPILRELKKPTAPAPSNVSSDPVAEEDEIYDDVDSSANAGSKPNEETPAEVQEEIYDDVDTSAATASAVVEEELYDDIAGATTQGTVKEEADAQDIYDDVDTSAQVPLYEVEDEGDSEEPGMALYEPVETIQQYVPQDNVSLVTSEGSASPKLGTKGQTLEKANKKKEEKERKEREKLEKKRKEEADKKMKKEEEERKKREKEERRRIEKERKAFNLKPDEEPKLIERHMATCDAKGKGKDISFSRGEYLDVISKQNCPKGKCLVQNSSGKLGYACLKDLGIDKRKSLLEATSPIALGVAFGEVQELYEDICEQSNSSPTSSIMSLQSSRSGTSLSTSESQPRFSHFMKPAATVQLGAKGADDDNGGGEDIYEDI